MELKKYSRFTTNSDFYNGYKLLSRTDSNGNKPEIYIAASNRSAGKTTFYNGMALHRFLTKGKKFLLLYRRRYEISQAADGFFKDRGWTTDEQGRVKEKGYPVYKTGYVTAIKKILEEL